VEKAAYLSTSLDFDDELLKSSDHGASCWLLLLVRDWSGVPKGSNLSPPPPALLLVVFETGVFEALLKGSSAPHGENAAAAADGPSKLVENPLTALEDLDDVGRGLADFPFEN